MARGVDIARRVFASLTVVGALYLAVSPISVRVTEVASNQTYAILGPVFGYVRYPPGTSPRKSITLHDYHLRSNQTGTKWGGPWFQENGMITSMATLLCLCILIIATSSPLIAKAYVIPSVLLFLFSLATLVMFSIADAQSIPGYSVNALVGFLTALFVFTTALVTCFLTWCQDCCCRKEPMQVQRESDAMELTQLLNASKLLLA